MPMLAINHHYFRETSTGSGIYPTTEQMLRTTVSELRSAGWRLGVSEDIERFLAEGGDTEEKIAILTFDDGLKEQIAAVRLLDSLGAAAICYVPTAPLVQHSVLDVHKLQMIRSVVDDEALALTLAKRFNFDDYAFDEEALAIQYRYDEPAGRKVKYFLNFVLDQAQRLDWLSDCFAAHFGDESAAARALYMDEADLKLLARSHILGSHAHAHLPLATLDAAILDQELAMSMDILTSLSGASPLGISYPFGGKSAVSEQVFDRARRAGYCYGFTMERGVNEVDAASMALKRIDTNDLAAWL